MSLTPNEKDLLAKKSDLEGILKPDANDILHLPDITISLAENQQGYTTSGLSKDGLVFAGAGTITGITSSEGISTTLAASQSAVSAKQDKIIAGSNITIAQDGKTISATDTTYSTFNGASASADGSTGLVPKPFIADKDKYLRGDGTWQTIQATPALNDLTDVDLTTPTDGQILKYDAVNQEWINANENPGVTELSGLTDVDVTTTTPTNGQGLVYNSTSEKWENANVLASASVSTLTDVNLTNLKNGQVLKYDTSTQKWVNAEDIDETNEFGPSAPTASMGKDGQIYMQYVNPTTITYSTVWTGLALSYYSNQPAKVEGFDPSKYYKIRVVGVSYDANVNDEKLVSEIPESSTYSGGWRIGDRMYITTQNNGTELWVYNAPDHPTYPSYITRIDAAQPSEISKVYGKIVNNWIEFPGGSGSSTLAGLSDVDITSPSAGQGLVYDATNQEWVNGNVSTSSSIDTLTDVNLTNLSNGQILKYNSTSQEWENANESGGGGSSALSDLTDVTVTSPSDGQVLTYDNTSGKWVNDTPTASSSISTLTDVNLTSLSDGQILKYDATNQEWVNADESGGGGGTSSGLVELARYTGAGAGYAAGDTITLSDNINNYDVLMFASNYEAKTTGFENALVTVNDFKTKYSTTFYAVYNPAAYTDVKYATDTTISVLRTGRAFVNAVYGMKLGSGGGGNAGGVDTLWTGDICPYVSGVTDITLDHPHTDYDYILVNTYDTNYNMYGTSIFYDLKTNYNYEDTIDSQGDVRNILLFQVLGDTSIRLKNYGQLGQCTHYTGFYGVKLGGSSVTPNPQGTPTDTLSTIEIDGTIYDIEGSGGGGGTSKYTEEVLWSGNESTSRWAEPIVLNIDITDYDMLSIRCGPSNEAGGVHIILTSEIPSGDSSGDGAVSLGTFTDRQYSIWLNKDNNILRIFTSTGVSINVKEVVGIKYGSGGGGGSGDSFITYTKTVTTTNYGWWTVEDKDGNILDPDEYIIVDISVTPYYYDVLWSTDSDGGNHYFATLININDVYEVRSSTTYDWTITYAKKDFSGGGGSSEVTYSTTEHKVGTWIDGSDVYEKTWDFGSGITISANNTWTNTPIVTADYDMDLLLNVTGLYGNGTVWGILSARCDTTYVQLQHPRGDALVIQYLTLRYTKASS